MGRTPSLTAQARCLDFYEWGKNGERESGSECDEGERKVGILVTGVMSGLICRRRVSRLMDEILGLFGCFVKRDT